MDGSEDVGVVDVAEPSWLLDVDPLVVWPVWVESVPVAAGLPVVDVVVDVFADPSVVLAALSTGLLGLAPPGLTTVEIPPVACGFTSTVTVVIVVEVDDAVWVAEDVEEAFADAGGTPESCDSVGGVTTGVEAVGAVPLESADVAWANRAIAAGGDA